MIIRTSNQNITTMRNFECSIPCCDNLQREMLEDHIHDWPAWLIQQEFAVYRLGEIRLCSACFAIVKSGRVYDGMCEDMRLAYRELQALYSWI